MIDAFLIDKKIAIEYNGIQHYKPTRFGSMTEFDAEIRFEEQLKRDQYIRNFCKENKILLIEIDGRIFKKEKLKFYLLNNLIPFINSYLE